MLASTSVFVSCKDYDDDIKNLQTQTDTEKAALTQAKADLEAAISKMRTELDAKDAQLQTLINTKANQTDLTEEINRAKAAEAALEARIATAESAITNINNVLANKVDKAAYDAELIKIYGQITAVDSKLTGALSSISTLEQGLQNEAIARAAVAADLEQQKTALNNLANRLDAKDAELLAQLQEAQAAIAALGDINNLEIDGEKKTVSEYLTDVMSDAQDALNKVSAIADQISTLNVLISNQVRGLVFSPSMYFGGIEGVALPVLKDYPLLAKQGDEYKNNGTKTNISLGGIAQYWVNPSTADLLDYKLDFYSNKAVTRGGMNYVSSDSAKITEYYVKNYYKNGVLSVPFHADFNKINNLAANEVPIIALQMTKGDTIVTSDFAIVKPIVYSNLKIADKDFFDAGKCNATDDITTPKSQHLHEVFADMKPVAIPATHKVKYNKTIDLMKLIETHFDMTDLDGNTSTNKKLSDADFETLGLSYIFENVGYKVGTNNTEESVHILLSEEGVVTPCSVTEDGKADSELVGDKARAAIGKLPIIRVRLVTDKLTGNNTVAVGYIKLEITDKDPDPIHEDEIEDPAPLRVDFTSALGGQPLYANCTATQDKVFTMTWSQIENRIYAVLNVSKEEFEKDYTLDHTIVTTETTTGTQTVIQNADQFTYKFQDPKHIYTQIKVAANYVGKISELQDANDPTTNVLRWTIGESDYEKLLSKAKYIDKDGNYTTNKDDVVAKVYPEELNATCRFTKNAGKKNEEHIYVQFYIPANVIRFAVAKIEDTKALAYWFKQWSSENADNADEAAEVRMNVPVPVSPYIPLANTDYTKVLHNYFIDNSVKTALIEPAKFTSFTSLEPNFVFTTPSKKNSDTWKAKGQSGYEYTMSISSDRTKMIATRAGNNQTVAELVDVTVGGKTLRQLNYVQGAWADDLLNYKGSKFLGEGESFTAFLQIVLDDATVCYPVDLISGQYFSVRFLRPVNFDKVTHKTVTDAPNDWQDINFITGAEITDWRNFKGGSGFSGNNFALNYYGIELLIEGNNLGKVKTDANMGKNARWATPNGKTDDEIKAYYNSCVTYDKINGLELQYKSGSTSILQYKNNSGVTGQFNLIIPVSMKYTFGQDPVSYQTHYVVVTVNQSTGQETAREQ